MNVCRHHHWAKRHARKSGADAFDFRVAEKDWNCDSRLPINVLGVQVGLCRNAVYPRQFYSGRCKSRCGDHHTFVRSDIPIHAIERTHFTHVNGPGLVPAFNGDQNRVLIDWPRTTTSIWRNTLDSKPINFSSSVTVSCPNWLWIW